MDSYGVDELTEDMFGHLCNIAIGKCNDKMEKRKAGCGGKAMRKRVLIKNFVSDLFKAHNEKTLSGDEGDDMSFDEHDLLDGEFECRLNLNQLHYNTLYEGGRRVLRAYDDSEADTTMCEGEETEEMEMDLLDDDSPKADCWLSGGPTDMPSQYSDYISGTSLLSSAGRDGAEGRADNQDSRLTMYDLYSNVSEGATEGGQPEASAPSGTFLMHDTTAHNYDSSYDLSSMGGYGLETLSSLNDVTDSTPLQPVRAEASDQLFLSSLHHNSYSVMKTYAPLSENILPDDVMAPPLSHSLTDLDAVQCTPKKRRSDELTGVMYDSLNSQNSHQKRIKL